MSEANWEILEVEGVADAIERAARKVADDWSNYVEYEDLVQDAYILVATKPDLMEGLSLGIGVLHHRLLCDLTDQVRTTGARSSRNLSYEAILEGEVE